MNDGFCSWMERGRLLASAAPRNSAEYDRWGVAGVTLVINLHSIEDDPAGLAARGMSSLHLPVVDFTAPSQGLLQEAVAAIAGELARGGVVAVHCHAGLGRTGTVLAAWLVAEGAPADQAISRVRKARPGSIETVDQEAAVYQFAERYPGRQP